MEASGVRTRAQARQRLYPKLNNPIPNDEPTEEDSNNLQPDSSDSEPGDETSNNDSQIIRPTTSTATKQVPSSGPRKDNNTTQQRPAKGLFTFVFEFVGGSPMLKVGLAVVAFVLLMGYLQNLFKPTTITSPKSRSPQQDFERGFKRVSDLFKSQTPHTDDSIHLALSRIIDKKEPGDPSSMIVLVPPQLSTSTFPLCFVKLYSQLLNQQNKTVPKIIDASRIGNTPAPEIASELRNYFTNGGLAVIVRGIDQLKRTNHFELFHTFTDSTHAKVKRAAYFFLVDVPSNLYHEQESRSGSWKQSDSKLSKVGNQILTQAWSTSELDKDYVDPLLTRIGSWGTILLNSGDTCDDNLFTGKVMTEL